MGNYNSDRERQPFSFGKPLGRVKIIAQRSDVRAQHQGPRTAGYLVLEIAVEAQSSAPKSSPSSASTLRSTGLAGWMVETACL